MLKTLSAKIIKYMTYYCYLYSFQHPWLQVVNTFCDFFGGHGFVANSAANLVGRLVGIESQQRFIKAAYGSGVYSGIIGRSPLQISRASASHNLYQRKVLRH
uniref:Uncharacterized protein n=1 Tax=Rhizophagus irregularis (strain DAOM 181602 / DAOM 197198 / MUCL 43194) TaxID=747089 RepID=U9UW30_RHIID